MTTTTTSTTTTSTTIDAFLTAICSGDGIPAGLYAADALLDATVPNWRMTKSGPDAIATEYRRWFADEAVMEELERIPTGDGEVVRYLLAWREQGVPHAAHHSHILTLDGDGHISKDVVFCGGRWDAALLAQIAEGRASEPDHRKQATR